MGVRDVKKIPDRLREAIRFAVTGGICFLIEYAVLVLLVDGLKLDTLIATPLAFLVSVTVNYFICLHWVFHAGDQGRAAKLGFLLTSVIGLALNEVLMLLFRAMWGEMTVLLTVASFQVRLYMLNKMLATLLVMVWNFFTKRAVMNSAWLNRKMKKNGGKA